MKFVDVTNDVAFRKIFGNENRKEVLKDEGLKSAYEDADKYYWSEAELDAYDYALMREQDDRGRMTLATKRATESTLEAVAKNLLNSGLTIEEIAKYTHLTIEQVIKLSGK